MRSSKAEVYLHFVWSTHGREPWLAGEVETRVLRCVEAQVRHAGCDVLAIGGTDDRVHLLVKTPSSMSPAKLMQYAKGVSSAMAGDRIGECPEFRWQQGYGVFSVSRTDITRVKQYVLTQREHHSSGRVWPAAEQTFAESEAPSVAAAD